MIKWNETEETYLVCSDCKKVIVESKSKSHCNECLEKNIKGITLNADDDEEYTVFGTRI